MKRGKWLLGGVVIALLIAGILIFNHNDAPPPDESSIAPASRTYKVGVFEVVRHPVLDAMAESFKSRLTEALSGKAEYVTMVPEGDASKTEQMAQKFATENYDLVFVIGTNLAQSVAKKTSYRKSGG